MEERMEPIETPYVLLVGVDHSSASELALGRAWELTAAYAFAALRNPRAQAGLLARRSEHRSGAYAGYVSTRAQLQHSAAATPQSPPLRLLPEWDPATEDPRRPRRIAPGRPQDA